MNTTLSTLKPNQLLLSSCFLFLFLQLLPKFNPLQWLQWPSINQYICHSSKYTSAFKEIYANNLRNKVNTKYIISNRCASCKNTAYSDIHSIKNNQHHSKKYIEHDYSSFCVTANSPVAILVLCGITRWQKAALAKYYG